MSPVQNSVDKNFWNWDVKSSLFDICSNNLISIDY